MTLAQIDKVISRVAVVLAVLMLGAAVIVLARATDKQDAVRWAQVSQATPPKNS